MRRKDRKINDQSKIICIANKCQVVNVAFSDGEIPYIVPLNFGIDVENDEVYLYFHSAKEGKKAELIKQNPMVSFSMYTNTRLEIENVACRCTMKFESVCGHGKISYVGIDEGIKALTCIMKNYAPDKTYNITQAITKSVFLWKIKVLYWTGKSNMQIENIEND